MGENLHELFVLFFCSAKGGVGLEGGGGRIPDRLVGYNSLESQHSLSVTNPLKKNSTKSL